MKKSLVGLLAAVVFGLGISQASAHDYRPHHRPHNHSGLSFGIIIGDPYWHQAPMRPALRGCTVERASAKALRMGIRHQTVFKSPHVIKVVGKKHGYRVKVSFARQPGCPVIRY